MYYVNVKQDGVLTTYCEAESYDQIIKMQHDLIQTKPHIWYFASTQCSNEWSKSNG